MQTTVINLFGGPGTGKSTAAPDIYSELKKQGESAELVREYVKHWAYTKRKIGKYDQLYLLGKQSHYESFLYGTVRYIVTDSPVLLAGFYATYYHGVISSYVDEAAKGFVNHSTNDGVVHLNFLLSRDFTYDPQGRYESEEDALRLDGHLEEYLNSFSTEYGKSFTPVRVKASEAKETILDYLDFYLD
jgi:RecA/RadA recombinase